MDHAQALLHASTRLHTIDPPHHAGSRFHDSLAHRGGLSPGRVPV